MANICRTNIVIKASKKAIDRQERQNKLYEEL